MHYNYIIKSVLMLFYEKLASVLMLVMSNKNKDNVTNKTVGMKDKVYNFKTKHKQGFTQSEMKTLLKDYPDINMDKFNDAMMCNTCMVIDDEIISYHCDVLTALRCGVENRETKWWEMD